MIGEKTSFILHGMIVRDECHNSGTKFTLFLRIMEEGVRGEKTMERPRWGSLVGL